MASESSAKNPTQRKHDTLTLAQKLQILREVDTGESYTGIAKKFNIGRSTVYGIRKKREKIEKFALKSECGLGNRQTMKMGRFPQLEETLLTWFLQEHRRHTPITADVLRLKALEFYEKIYNKTDFNASEGWLWKYTARFGIRLQTVAEEKLTSSIAAEPFKKAFKNRIEELDLTPDQVYNADESSLYWRLLSSSEYTSNTVEKTSHDKKIPDDHITIMPCANASGRHKLKLLVIGKLKSLKSFKNVELPVIYRSQRKAWLTKGLFHDWFHHYFVPEVKSYLKSNNLPDRALLVLDNAQGHGLNDELISNDGTIKTIFLPAICAPYLQPMDQNVIQLTKNTYKKKILLDCVARNANIFEYFERMTMKDVVLNVANAWDEIKQQTIQVSWQNLWPTLTMDDEAWDKIEDPVHIHELINLVTIINESAGLTRKDIEHWMEENTSIYDPPLTDEEIINQCVQSQDTIEEVIIDADSCTRSDLALESADTCIKWAEENGVAYDMLTNLRKMRDQIINKIYCDKKEVKIEPELEIDLP